MSRDLLQPLLYLNFERNTLKLPWMAIHHTVHVYTGIYSREELLSFPHLCCWPKLLGTNSTWIIWVYYSPKIVKAGWRLFQHWLKSATPQRFPAAISLQQSQKTEQGLNLIIWNYFGQTNLYMIWSIPYGPYDMEPTVYMIRFCMIGLGW